MTPLLHIILVGGGCPGGVGRGVGADRALPRAALQTSPKSPLQIWGVKPVLSVNSSFVQ
jgi:hypothetical protein